MDKQQRPLDEYFEAARREPGISEQEVRSIVHAAAPSSALRRRWIVAGVGAVGAIAIAIGGLAGGDQKPAGDPVPTQAVRSAQVGEPRPAAPNAAATSPRRDDENATTQTISTTERTMNPKNAVRAAGIGALALVTLGSPADAQERRMEPKRVEKTVKIEMKHELDPVMEKMATELGRQAAEYWTARLNSYKARIDRTLSPSDLEKLNRMRVRFGVMVAKHADVEIDAEQGTVRQGEEVFIHRQEKQRVDGDNVEEKKIERQIVIDANMGSGAAMEFFELHGGAQGIASSYRGDMDALGKDVLTDAVTFIRTIKGAADRFAAEHRVTLEKTEDGKEMLMEIEEGDDILNALDNPEMRPMIQMVYSSFIEPLVMLYDGTDLNSFFQNAGPLASAVTGYKLPETSALKAAVPNPATGSTTIAYTLEEPSSATTLRLFDATGALVGTYDQGAREAGEHAATVDLSALTSGTYLYHLTVKTAAGERVYSKTLQVAK
jgi:hypothetical protein